MSETTIADHGYIPEEHAPDPVIGHGDPTPPGKVAIWLFLASEIMFFIAILGTYIVLRSGSPHLFSDHAAALSKPLAGVNTLVLIFSSLTMALSVDAAQKGNRKKLITNLAITLVCAFGFMGIKFVEYKSKVYHFTIVTTDGMVHDGHVVGETDKEITLHGFSMKIPDDKEFDIHLVSEQYVRTHQQTGTPAAEGRVDKGQADSSNLTNPHGESAHSGEANAEREGEEIIIAKDKINSRINYGPWKNIFYSCYFALTGIHGLHVIGGIIPIGMLLVHALRGKLFPAHTEYVGLYWHFVDLVWIFLFPLLYLI